MTVTISQGVCSIIGNKIIPGWTLRIPGRADIKCRTLAQAKCEAAQLTDAIGPWKREMRPTGVRQAMRTYYTTEVAD